MRQRKRRNNTSGTPGVWLNTQQQRWHASIRINGKPTFLGYFINLEDAIAVREAAELKYWGPKPATISYPDPDTPGMQLIELTMGRVACVDSSLFERLNQHSWSCAYGYAVCRRIDAKMHTTVMKHAGRWESGLEVDHINHCGYDNRLENLRMATHSQNLMHQKISSKNTSGATGVHWYKRKQMWQSRIMVAGKNRQLGYFAHKVDAIAARHAAEIKYFGEFRHDPTLLCPLWETGQCPDCAARAKDLIAAGLTPITATSPPSEIALDTPVN